jgi:hypothetical protein
MFGPDGACRQELGVGRALADAALLELPRATCGRASVGYGCGLRPPRGRLTGPPPQSALAQQS